MEALSFKESLDLDFCMRLQLLLTTRVPNMGQMVTINAEERLKKGATYSAKASLPEVGRCVFRGFALTVGSREVCRIPSVLFAVAAIPVASVTWSVLIICRGPDL